MKKIKIIECGFAAKTGVQDLYETIEECEAVNKEDADCLCAMSDADVIGAVLMEGGGFIEVYEDYDKFEILD